MCEDVIISFGQAIRKAANKTITGGKDTETAAGKYNNYDLLISVFTNRLSFW